MSGTKSSWRTSAASGATSSQAILSREPALTPTSSSGPSRTALCWRLSRRLIPYVFTSSLNLEKEPMLKLYQSIDHYITYSVITAQPQLTYSSVVSTIRLFPITSGANEGHTFVQWSGNFSSDADAGVIEDAKFKRREALADLAKAVAKK